MAKIVPLFPELIFLDVIPEISPQFIERLRNEHKFKKK